jgi:2-oxoglutarate ferredoxin oxidoreductase subunit alpha
VEELRKQGKKIGFLRLKTMWPFAEEMIRDVGGKAETIFVPEMNSGQVAGEIMKHARCEVVKYNQTNGEIIHPHTIVEALRSL